MRPALPGSIEELFHETGKEAFFVAMHDDGPAAEAKIEPGDVILKFDGKDVHEMRKLPRIVAETEVGKPVPVEIWRSNKKITLSVTVGRLREEEKAEASTGGGDTGKGREAEKALRSLGLTLAPVSDELRGRFKLADDAKGVSGWAVDESPAVEGVPSPKCTMNFNNGKDYDDKVDGKSVETKGTATSAEIDLTGATAAKGSFMLYYDIDTSSSYDLFFVEISEDDFKTVAQSWQIPKTSDNKGKWHEQSADLTAFAGKKIKVRFRFDSKDTTSNSGKGVFIDDLKLVIVPKT